MITAHTCMHGTPDWRQCPHCLDEVETALVIAKAYLTELTEAQFTEDSFCRKPVSEPVQGRSFQQIASLALSALS